MRGRRMLVMAGMFALVLPLWGSAPPGAVALLDAPGGHPVGWVREPSGLEVLEERGGWKRVRLEGWIAQGGGGVVRGEAGAASGADVVLLSSSPPARQRLAELAEHARSQQEPLAADVERLKRERNRALRIDNFSEATRRYDALDAEYDVRSQELSTLRKRLLAELVASLAPDTVMASALRGDGTFELHPPTSGTYQVLVAVTEAETFPCCWQAVEVGGEDVWLEFHTGMKGKGRRRSTRDR